MADPDALSDGIRDALALDGDVAAIRRYYDGWADNYDADVGADQYALPDQIAQLLAAVVTQDGNEPIHGLTIQPGPPDPAIADVGCGTGLIGARLHGAGYRTIDGLDLSPAMIEQAKDRGCYRRLQGEVDITKPLAPNLVGTYDIVIVGGVFTVGHVPPTALATVASLARPGGLLLVTTRTQYYDETNYQAVSDQLETDRTVQLITVHRDRPYTLDSVGHYWAYLVSPQ